MQRDIQARKDKHRDCGQGWTSAIHIRHGVLRKPEPARVRRTRCAKVGLRRTSRGPTLIVGFARSASQPGSNTA